MEAENAASQALDAAKEPKAAPKKVRSIVIDTVTEIMKKSLFADMANGKVQFDEWKDRGVELSNVITQLVDMGFTLVGITGREGTGKTYGMKFLEPGTNIWYNADNKEITYKGGREAYGTKQKPTYLHKIPKTYAEITEHIKSVKKKDLFEDVMFAFIIMHVDEFKDPQGNVRERAKVMGKIGKSGIDSMLTMNYYVEIVQDEDTKKPVYRMRTKNTGSNTGRSLEEQHGDKDFIDNNFQIIIDSYMNY